MDKRLLKGFEQAEEKGKIRRNISIDWDLDQELKKTNINVSEIINEFLWYWLKKQERDNNKTDKEEKNE